VALDNCTHCGAETAPEQMLCGKCFGWLGKQTALDEPTLLEALQFDSPPVPGVGPIVTSLAFTALVLLLESALAVFLFLDALPESTAGAPYPPEHQIAVLLLLASSLLSFTSLALGTYMARRRTFPVLLVTGAVFAGLTAVSGLAAVLMRYTDFLLELRALLVFRGVAVALFAVPLAFALRRQRKLKQGRERLQAVRDAAAG
jgi:hypothetical protein